MKKTTSKILSFFLALSLLLVQFGAMTVIAGPSDPTVTFASVTAEAGEEVEVTVSVANNPGIVSMSLMVAYDPALTITNVADAGKLGNAYHSNNKAANPYKLSWGDDVATENNMADGTLVTITFKVADDAVAGDYNIAATLVADDTYDFDFNPVDFDVVAGKITIEDETIVTPPVTTGPAVTFASVTAEAGEEVDVTVSVANNPGIVSMSLMVAYDSALTITNVADAGKLGNAYHSNNKAANPYKLSWGDDVATENNMADGTLVTITFKVADNAAAGDYNIAATLVADDTYDFDFNPVDFEVVAGKITVEGGAVVPPVVNKYTVIYKVNGEVVKEYTDVEEGSETPVYEYTAPEGYTFSGWGEIPATVTEDLVIEGTTEEIVIPTFTVTFMVADLVVGTIVKDEGESVEKTEYPAVEPKEGHTIVWDNEGPITAEATVYGTYVANTYKVTYKVDGEIVHEDTVEYGAEIPAYEYEVADGYTFSGFGEIPATMPATDLVFEGTTEEIPATMYTVTFVVMGEVYAEIEVEEGTAIGDLMPADPEVATYIFNGWFNGEGNPVDAEAVITGDIEVTADFTKDARDVNGDDVIDVNDAIYLLNHCALPELYPVDASLDFDFEGDDVINSKDAIALFNSIANPVLYSLR